MLNPKLSYRKAKAGQSAVEHGAADVDTKVGKLLVRLFAEIGDDIVLTIKLPDGEIQEFFMKEREGIWLVYGPSDGGKREQKFMSPVKSEAEGWMGEHGEDGWTLKFWENGTPVSKDGD